MKKIYEQNELTFAFIWIGIYCVLQSLANPLNEAIGIKNSASAVFCIIQAVVLFSFVRKNNLLVKYGLCRPCASARQFLYYIPLLIVATSNLWNGIAVKLSALDTVFHVALMLCVGFIEEVIFRGFLFKAIAKDNVKTAIVISSITFGIGHLLNLFNGSGMSLAANLFQIAYAVALGFLFVMIFYHSGSLIPCIAAHSVINILSAFATDFTIEKRIFCNIIEFTIIAVYLLILAKTFLRKQETSTHSDCLC